MLTYDTPARRAAAGPLCNARLSLALGLAIMLGSATVYSQDLAVFKDASGNVVATIDQNGRYSTKGKLIATSGPIALLSGTQYYSIKDSTGKVYFAIDLETGDTSVLTTGGTGSTASTPFVLKSATGVPVFQIEFGEGLKDEIFEIPEEQLSVPPAMWTPVGFPPDIDWAALMGENLSQANGEAVWSSFPVAQARFTYYGPSDIDGYYEYDYDDSLWKRCDVTDKSWRLKFRRDPYQENRPLYLDEYLIAFGFRSVAAWQSISKFYAATMWDPPVVLPLYYWQKGRVTPSNDRTFALEEDTFFYITLSNDEFCISLPSSSPDAVDNTKVPFKWQDLDTPGMHILSATAVDDAFTNYDSSYYNDNTGEYGKYYVYQNSDNFDGSLSTDPNSKARSRLFLYDMEFILPDHLPNQTDKSRVFVGFNLLPLFRHNTGVDGVDMKEVTFKLKDAPENPVYSRTYKFHRPAGSVLWNGLLENANGQSQYPEHLYVEADVEWNIPEVPEGCDSLRKPWQQVSIPTDYDGYANNGRVYHYLAPDCFVDLDVDSNNNGSIDQQVTSIEGGQSLQYYLSNGLLVDDLVENLAQEPGLLLGINNDDDNGDGQQDRLDNQLNSGTGADHDDLDDTEILRLRTAPLQDTDDVILKVVTPNLLRIFAPISNTAPDYKVVLKPAHSTIILKHDTALVDPDDPNGIPLLTNAQVDNLRTRISGTEGCKFRIEGFAQGREKIELKVLGANGKNGKDEVIVTVIGISKISSHYYGPVVASDMDHVPDGATDVSAATVYARAPIYLSQGVHARLNEYLVAPSNTMADTASPQNPHEKNPCYVVAKIGPETLSGDDQSRFIYSNGDYKLGIMNASTNQDWKQLNEANFMAHVGHFTGNSVNGTPTDANTINFYRWSFDPQSRSAALGVTPASASRQVNVEPELDLISFDHIVRALGLTDDDLGGASGSRYIKSGLYFFQAQGISTPGEQRIRIQSRSNSQDLNVRVDRKSGESVVTVLGVDVSGNQTDDGTGPYPRLHYSDPCPSVLIINDPSNSHFPAPPVILANLTNKNPETAITSLSSGTVDWSMDIEFVRGRTNEPTFYIQPRHIRNNSDLPPNSPANVFTEEELGELLEKRQHAGKLIDTFTEPTALGINEIWGPRHLMFPVPLNQWIVRGGTATIKFAYHIPATSGTPGGVLTGRRAIMICGVNPPSGVGNGNTILSPASNSVVSYIDTLDNVHWYARFVVAHESDGWHQFNSLNGTGYKNNLGPNFANIHGSGMPNWGYPDGWGLAQHDPYGSKDNLWNWKQNILDGLAELSRKRAGSPFSEEHVQNGQVVTNGLPTSISVRGHEFTFNGANGTYTYWDLDTIKRYNGGITFSFDDDQKIWTWVKSSGFKMTLSGTIGTVTGDYRDGKFVTGTDYTWKVMYEHP